MTDALAELRHRELDRLDGIHTQAVTGGWWDHVAGAFYPVARSLYGMTDSTAPAATVGQHVLYKLNSFDADQINRRRADHSAFQQSHVHPHEPGQPAASGHQAHVGNSAAAGQVCPGVVVRTFGGPAANLQVWLDGTDTLWATSRTQGDGNGEWRPSDWSVLDDGTSGEAATPVL